MNLKQAKKALGIKRWAASFCGICGPWIDCGSNCAVKLTSRRCVKKVKGLCVNAGSLTRQSATPMLANSYEYGTGLKMTWGDPWVLRGKVVWYDTKTVRDNLLINAVIIECANGYALLPGDIVPTSTREG